MKISVITTGIPNPTSGGGALTAWSVIRSLRMADHKVQVLAIDNVNDTASRRSRDEMLERLQDGGVTISRVDARLVSASGGTVAHRRLSHWGKVTGMLGSQSAALDRLQWFFPISTAASEVERCLREFAPDSIFVYHFDALATAFSNTVAPTMAGVGDPVHLPDYFRNQYAMRSADLRQCVRTWIRLQRRAFWQKRLMVAMLNGCAISGAFAAHHAAWLERSGAVHCAYLRTPIPDAAGDSWATKRTESRPKKPKILLIGHMRGTATLSGLDFFAREVLPLLEQRIGTDGVEVHLVGGFDPPGDLKALLSRPNVIFRGQIEPADEEFLSADIVVVPTPIPLGIRVRIITAFSYGCCIVTHRANAQGTPELQNKANAMVTADGPAMADSILRCLASDELRERLGREARRTYKSAFSLETAGAAIVRELEKIGGT